MKFDFGAHPEDISLKFETYVDLSQEPEVLLDYTFGDLGLDDTTFTLDVLTNELYHVEVRTRNPDPEKAYTKFSMYDGFEVDQANLKWNASPRPYFGSTVWTDFKIPEDFVVEESDDDLTFEDDDDFEWCMETPETRFVSRNGRSKTCKWLGTKERRMEKECNSERSEASELCPITCDSCDE